MNARHFYFGLYLTLPAETERYRNEGRCPVRKHLVACRSWIVTMPNALLNSRASLAAKLVF